MRSANNTDNNNYDVESRDIQHLCMFVVMSGTVELYDFFGKDLRELVCQFYISFVSTAMNTTFQAV